MNIIKGLPREAKPNEPVSIDLEISGIPTGKLHRPVGEFACASISYLSDDRDTVYQFTDAHDVREALERISRGSWALHNAQFDLRQLRRWADVPERPIWDTMLAEQDLFGGYYSRFDLGSCSTRWLHKPMEKEVRKDFIKSAEMTPEKSVYAAQDALNTVQIAAAQWDYIADNQISMKHYWNDADMIWTILDMPGVKIDVAGWAALATEFEQGAEQLRAKFDFNVGVNGTTDATKERLEKLLRHPVGSIDEEHLVDYADDPKISDKARDFIKDLLELRGLAKLTSTYGKNWLENYVEEGDLVWTEWKITGAKTGRMASGDPNLQNVPQRRMPIFRKLFIKKSAKGLMVVSDVEQQEPRILAYLSEDENLTGLLKRHESPHIFLGRRLFNDETFSKKDPRYLVAKSINLAIGYGLTPKGLIQHVHLDDDSEKALAQAEHLINQYFSIFPAVRSYMSTYRASAFRQGYVETTLGRRCYVNPYSTAAQNNAINSPIQGTGGEQLKMAANFLHKNSAAYNIPFSNVLDVHDELVSDLPDKKMGPKYTALLKEAWRYVGEQTIPGIPVEIEIASGENWGCKQ